MYFYPVNQTLCMKLSEKTTTWLAQIRANFLLLAAFLVAIGLAYAVKYGEPGSFDPWHAILILTGTISAHISVNLINEFYDFRSRIDFHTTPTPFSGGSQMLVKGKTSPGSVVKAAAFNMLLAAAIGAYFSLRVHWSIAPISLLGAFAILFYNPLLSRYLLGEFFAGLTLGSLVVIGSFIAMTASPGEPLAGLVPLELWLIAIPPGILTALLLLLNEFPDAEADRQGGRKHLVIALGWRKAAWTYTGGMALTHAIILALPLLGVASPWTWLALLPLPLGLQAARIALRNGSDPQALLPAQGLNVITVLATDLLLALAVVLSLI